MVSAFVFFSEFGSYITDSFWIVLSCFGGVMGRQIWKPGNMLYPLPVVMISVCDKEGKTNIIKKSAYRSVFYYF